MQDLIDLLGGGVDAWRDEEPASSFSHRGDYDVEDIMPELYVDQLRLLVERKRQREICKNAQQQQEEIPIPSVGDDDDDDDEESSDVDDGADAWFRDDQPEDLDAPLKERRLTKSQIRKRAEKALRAGDTFLGDPDEVRRFFAVIYSSEDAAMNVLHMHAALHGYYYDRHKEYPLKRLDGMVKLVIYNCR
jgi:hypothetical protein